LSQPLVQKKCSHVLHLWTGAAGASQRGAEIRTDPALIESFGRAMRENLTTGSMPFRKPTFAR
jgi:hypothetical protein